MQNEPTFAELFKKYRLRAQITTLAEFANLLAEEGMVYENSLFSRWQSGDRTPKDRKTLLSVIRVFAKQGGIRNQQQANELLTASGQVALTAEEDSNISPLLTTAKSSANELVEYEKVENGISEGTLEIINLTVNALNHTLSKRSEVKILQLTEHVGHWLEQIKINKAVTVLFTLYLSLLCWWISIFASKETSTMNNFGFALAYSFLPIVGGILGWEKSIRWGGIKSSVGKALFYISSGLIAWGLGQLLWSYYVLMLKVEIPYPSFSDLLFILSWPLWGIGIYHLSKAAGIKFQLTKKGVGIKLTIIPLLMIVVSYYLLIVVAKDGVLVTSGDLATAFFDLIYPIMDALLAAEILLVFGLTYRQLQSKYKSPITLIFVGIIANYGADFFFSYTTTNNTFFNASYVDMLFTTSLFILGYAVNSFDVS